MHSRIWRSQYYKRIFKSVLLGTCSVLLLGLTILYASFCTITFKHLEKVNRHYIENTVSGVEYNVLSSYDNAINAYVSTNGKILMSALPPSQVELMHSIQEIQFLFRRDPLIHSVYFINSRTGVIYTFGHEVQQMKLDEFYDRELLNMILKEKNRPASGFPYMIRDSRYLTSTTPVDTRIMAMPGGDVVVVNLQLSQLFRSLEIDSAVYEDATFTYCVYYDQDECVYSANEQGWFDESAREQLQQALKAHNWKSSFSAMIGGKWCMVNLFTVENSDYQYVSVIPKGEVISNFLHYTILFIVISVLAGIAAVLTNLVTTSRLYKPIESITKSLPDAPQQAPEDEIEFIESSIAQTTRKMADLFAYKEKHLLRNQSYVIRQQLLFDRFSNEEFWQHCEDQEIACRPGELFFLAYADWKSEPFRENDPGDARLLCYAISNVFHELMGENTCIQDVPLEDNKVVFWCCMKELPSDEHIRAVLSGIEETFRKCFEIRLSFSYASGIQEPCKLYPAMQKLQELARYQYFYKDGMTRNLAQFNPDQLCSELPVLPDMAAIEASLRSRDAESVANAFAGYWDQLEQYTFEAVQASVNMLASRIITIIKRIQVNQPGFPKADHHVFFAEMTGASTIYQAQECLMRQIQWVVEQLAQTENESGSRIIDSVIQFLDANYQDFNVSSKSVALECHISVPYLNSLFKQKTGKTLAAYLKQLRLEKAKQMLVETSLSVEAIARKVGFENTKYFYTLFKNEYGASPSSYRISHNLLEPSQN